MVPNWHCYAFATLVGWYYRSLIDSPPSSLRSSRSTMLANGLSYSAREMRALPSLSSIWKARTVSGRVVSCQTPGELIEVEVAVVVTIVGRVAVIADLVDLCLAELAITVGVDGLEYFHCYEAELSHGEETHAAKTAFRVARACECYTTDSRGDAYANHRLRSRSHGHAPTSNADE